MSENHLIADISLKAIIEKDRKILFVLGADDDYWQLPGGRINEGEELEDAFKREGMEELGLDVKPKNIFEQFFGQGGYEDINVNAFSKPVTIEVLPLPEDGNLKILTER